MLPGRNLVAPAQASEHERITRHALDCAGAKPGACFEPTTLLVLAGNGATKRGGDPALTYGSVGEPDRDAGSFMRLPFPAQYHCDNGDYDIVGVKTNPAYAPTASANTALTDCRTQVVADMDAAVAAAQGILSPTGLVIADQVRMLAAPSMPPTPSPPSPVPCFGTTFASAKCQALRRFGHALHTAQDFYSHTNWVDRADPKLPVSVTNPPGLNRTANGGLAPFMNLASMPKPDPQLISGCYDDGELFAPTEGCVYGSTGFSFLGVGNATPGFPRIRHLVLQKDEGTIDPKIGKGTTLRGAIRDNFKRAVQAAIAETKRKWGEFKTRLRDTLVKAAGADPRKQASARRRAAGIICAMVHDDPVKDCVGRYVGLVIDSSGSNSTTDPNGVRRRAADTIRIDLVSAGDAGPGGKPDLVTVVDFDDSSRVVYPLGDPDSPDAARAIAAVDESGGTYIAGGVRTALAELARAGAQPDKSAIVLFTDGEDSDQAALVSAIDAATAQGVRVSYGVLAPSGQTTAERAARRAHAMDSGLKEAILRSGGVFGTIRSAAEQETFVQLVEDRGLTAIDDPDGSDDGGAIVLGVEVSGTLDPPGDTDVWTYDATAGEGLKVTLTPPDGVVGRLDVRTVDDRAVGVGGSGPGPTGAVTLPVRATGAGPIAISVAGGGRGLYTLRIDPEPAAPVPARPRSPRVASPLVIALGPGRVTLTPRGRSLRILRRGEAPLVAWRVRARRPSALRLVVTGPGNARLSLRSRVRRGPSTVRARLPLLGSRRGLWRLDLISANRVIASTLVGTR